MKFRFLHTLLLFSAFFVTACNDNVISSIPDYPVYLRLDLVSSYPNFKNSTNQFLVFKDRAHLTESSRIGYGGVLLNTGLTFDDGGNSNYYAYDLSCPYEADNNIRVYPNKNGTSQVICEKCGSVYEVGYGMGNPIKGPAKEFLKRYKTSLNGNYLQVFR